jgi:cupin superfamily acireductone dioxygenase involved in methionine salvage
MGVKYQIIIEIDEDENISMETLGIKGPKCVEEIKKITKNIAEIESTKKTKEYYEQDKVKVKNKNSIFSK